MCKLVTCCLKFFLVIFALLLLIVGIILTIVGAFLLWGLKFLLKSAVPMVGQLNTLLKSIGVTEDSQSIIDFIAKNSAVIGGVAFAIGMVLLIVSLLLMIVMCCCSTKCLYIVVIVILSVIVVALVVLLAYCAAKPDENVFAPLQVFLQKNVIDKYEGLNATNAESILVNVLHIRLQCCGLTGSSNFNSAPPSWKSGIVQTKPYSGMEVPISCCKFNIDFTIPPADLDNCIRDKTSDRKDKGCWDPMKTQMKTYLNYIFIAMGITIGVMVFMILVLIIFICCMDKFE